jgi:dTDP-4-amino-4,6-dideoxy-D-galactose acyltransferase
MTAATNGDCELLPWDSEHFGVTIARANAPRLTAASSAQIDAWCRESSVACLYFSCDAGDRESVRLAELGRFRLVDMKTTFFRALPAGAPAFAAREDRTRRAVAADADWVAGLARTSFGDSRFYFDGNFDLERCHLLYERWARKAMGDEAQTVWVAQTDGRPSGFVTCPVDAATRVGSIGLIAVAPDFRGRSVGDDLVGRAVSHFGAIGMAGVRVVTQARNLKAVRLYERCGFLVEDLRLVYHKWYRTPEGSP